jgi:hypothetical protein
LQMSIQPGLPDETHAGKRIIMTPGSVGMARSSILSTLSVRWLFHTAFRSFAREFADVSVQPIKFTCLIGR